MKRKTKRYADGGLDVEGMKQGIAAGTPAEDDGMRPGRNMAFEPDTAPTPRPKPKTKVGSGASGFPLKKKEKAPYEGFKKGGSASSRADGCAQRGKTRGKMY